MKTMVKAALGALALASLGAASTTPANAQVSFGFAVRTPGYYPAYVAPAYRYGNPCYRPYRFRPAYCNYRYRAPVYSYDYRYPRPYYRGYAYAYPRYRDPYYWRR